MLQGKRCWSYIQSLLLDSTTQSRRDRRYRSTAPRHQVPGRTHAWHPVIRDDHPDCNPPLHLAAPGPGGDAAAPHLVHPRARGSLQYKDGVHRFGARSAQSVSDTTLQVLPGSVELYGAGTRIDNPTPFVAVSLLRVRDSPSPPCLEVAAPS